MDAIKISQLFKGNLLEELQAWLDMETPYDDNSNWNMFCEMLQDQPMAKVQGDPCTTGRHRQWADSGRHAFWSLRRLRWHPI